MEHPIVARRLNRQLASLNADTDQLPETALQYADRVVRGLHLALRNQAEPAYRRPKHPVDGWGLVNTSIETEGNTFGIPITEYLGSRTIYLAAKSNAILRVLTAPSARRFMESRVIQIRQTTIPVLLAETPALYPTLLDAVDESIQGFQLAYQYEQPSFEFPLD